MNSYFTPILFVSDNSNLAYFNMNQPNTPGWTYPNQYNLYPQSYDHNFQNNFNSSQSQWGCTSLGSNFLPPCPQFSQFSKSPFPNFASYTPFPGPPIEEKFELEKSIEANLQEAER